MSANNFTMVLNRKELVKKLTMKMEKELKRKNKYENSNTSKNDDEDVSTWTSKYCQSFLKSCNTVHCSSVDFLRKRCLLLKRLIFHDIE